MTANPYLLVSLDAHVVNARKVLDALGTGPAGLGRALVEIDEPSPNYNEPAVAWCQFDQSGDSEFVAKLNGLCGGALPAIDGYWGEEGVISSLDAQQAFMDEHSTVISAINVPVAQREATINGALAGLGYKFRDTPEP
jgi:hypothetical protein